MNDFEALKDEDLREKLGTAQGQAWLRQRIAELSTLRDELGAAYRLAPLVAPAKAYEATACWLRTERKQCDREIARISAALDDAKAAT